MRARFFVIVSTAASVSAACGGVERGPAEVAGATRTLSAAEEAGAPEDPRAGYFLDLARRELYRARVQARLGDGEGARAWADRATADADVARMMAIEAATREAARRTEADAEAISLPRGGGAR
jgi:hypothetical protein